MGGWTRETVLTPLGCCLLCPLFVLLPPPQVSQDTSLRRRLEASLQALAAAQAREARDPRDGARTRADADRGGDKGDKGDRGERAVERTLSIPRPPAYAVWRDERALTDTLTAQATRHAALDAVLAVEAAVSDELHHLLDLRVLPAAELAQIRREVRCFRESFVFDEGTGPHRETQPQGQGQGQGQGSGGAESSPQRALDRASERAERGGAERGGAEEAVQAAAAELRLAEKVRGAGEGHGHGHEHGLGMGSLKIPDPASLLMPALP